MPIVGGHGKRWGMIFPQEKGVSKRVPKGKVCMGLKLYYLWGQLSIFFLVECMRAQSLNSCKRVGVKSHIP
jgi:hypothetical protein